jgi:hypothetical protein
MCPLNHPFSLFPLPLLSLSLLLFFILTMGMKRGGEKGGKRRGKGRGFRGGGFLGTRLVLLMGSGVAPGYRQRLLINERALKCEGNT